MVPKLYDGFSVEQANYGQTFLGPISHCSKCLVTETTASEYTISLETNVNDPTASALISQRIVAAKPNPHDPLQFFEIQDTERSNGIIRATGKHVKNYLCQCVSEGNTGYSDQLFTFRGTPKQVFDELMSEYIHETTGFSFTSDIDSQADFYLGFNEPKKLGSVLGGEEGSMLDMFGGEFYYNNYSISLLRSRGKVSNYALRYGVNISSAKQTESCAQLYSHILPYGTVATTGGKNTRLFAPVFRIPNNLCRTKKVLPLDCSEALTTFQVGNDETGRPEARAAMTQFAYRYAASNRIGEPSVGISVTSRSDLDGMLQLGLCDTIKVILDNFDTTTTAKITSVTYNSLLERWEKMTIGAAPISLTDIILNKRRFNLR